MDPRDAELRLEHDVRFGALVIGLLALIGGIDYASGAEVRVYPLYFLPIGMAAWWMSRFGAIAACLLATVAWTCSNYIADLHYSHPAIWVLNAGSQLVAFMTVALLILQLRRQAAAERLLARSDPLTGLPNARSFYEAAGHELARQRRAALPLTLAYLDLDNFKAVNDQQGHQAGDALLAEVGRILRATIRATDAVARLGGDEFVILLPETDAAPARLVLERLHRATVDAMAANGWPVTCSIGAVVFAQAPATVDAMVGAADALMYRVKAAGKNALRIETAAATG